MKSNYIIFIIGILLILVGIEKSLGQEHNGQIMLRTFRELENIFVHQIIYRNPSTIFLFSQNWDFFKWNGKNWEKIKFPDEIQNKNILLFPYDFNHYLISYTNNERDYHSKLIYYDGVNWRKIPNLQPYLINTVSFVDSHRFWAGGLNGSLFFYNGQKVLLKQPPEIGNIYAISAYDENNFFTIISTDKKKNSESKLIKYEWGQWKKILNLDQNISYMFFWTPDSGILLNKKGQIYLFANQELNLLSNIQIPYPFYFVFVKQQKTGYFWFNRAFWKITLNGHIEKIFDYPSLGVIYPVENGYLLLEKEQIFYSGKDSIGVPLSAQKPRFIMKPLSNNNSMGVSHYNFQDGRKGLYFVIPMQINKFSALQPNFEYGIENIRFQEQLFLSGLLDFQNKEYYWDASLAFGDLDNDGDRDAILSNLKGLCHFFENIGQDQFRDITSELDVQIEGRINIIQLIDFNLDGYLDLVFGDELGPMRFVLNKGFMRFKEITSEFSTLGNLTSYMPAFADLDGDGDADFLAYSLNQGIRYFENTGLNSQKLPVFVERSGQSQALTNHFEYFTQSVTFSDYDNDGDLDILLANRNHPLKLFRNEGHFYFVDVSHIINNQKRFLAYGAAWGDLDQDGYQDFVLSTLGKNYIFWNHNAQYFDADSTHISMNNYSYTTNIVLDDLEDDGDLDLIICNYYFPNDFLGINQLNQKSFIGLKLACKKACNTEGIGSNVYLYELNSAGQKKLKGMRYIQTATSYNAHKLPVAYFGVEPGKTYQALIQYPGGQTQRIRNLKAGQVYLIEDNVKFSIWDRLAFFTQDWFLRKDKRSKVLQILLFVLIVAAFNFYIRRRTYWAVRPVLFFNTFIVSFYLLTNFILKNIFLNPGWLQSIYIIIVSSVVAFIFIEKYTISKNSELFQHELFDLFRQFHHSKGGLTQVDHLLFFCNNIKNTEKVQLWKEFNREILYFKNYTLPFIRSILQKSLLLKNLRGQAEKSLKLIKCLERFCARTLTPRDLNAFKQYLLQLKNNLLFLLKKIELEFASPVVDTITQTLYKFSHFTQVKIMQPPLSKQLQAVIPSESLSLVLANILQNAQEAMLSQKDRKLEINIVKNYDKIMIDIKDNGPGIAPELRSQIFEEGYSTKGTTGLGLYHARKILKHYGGDLQLLNNNPDKGATFRIILKEVRDE